MAAFTKRSTKGSPLTTAELDANWDAAFNASTGGAIAGVITGNTTQTGTLAMGSQFSHRNKLINGDFSVWQRGTSVVSSTGVYTADRWRAYSATAHPTFSLDATRSVTNSTCLLITGIASNTVTNFGQSVEAAAMGHMADKTVTFSYEIYSSTARTVGATTYYFNSTDSGIFAMTTSLSNGAILTTGVNTWQKVTYSITLPSSFKNGGYFDLTLGAITAGQNVRIRNVQLEEGTQATPFESRPPQVELALCQRYCYDPLAGDTSSTFMSVCPVFYDTSTTFFGTLKLPVQMRTVPTLQGLTVSNFSVGYPGGTALSTLVINGTGSTKEAILLSGTTSALTANKTLHLFRPGTTERLLFISEL